MVGALQQIDDIELILFTEPGRPLHPSFHYLLGSRTQVATVRAPKALIWEQFALPVALRHFDVDVFHAPADGGLPAWTSCGAVLTYLRALDKSTRYWTRTGDLPGAPADYGVPGLSLSNFYGRLRHDLFRQLYLRSADRVITVSEFAKWELVTLLGVSERKIDVIPMAADDRFWQPLDRAQVERVRAAYGLPSRYFLYSGGLELWKNVDGLLRAFAKVRRSADRPALVIAGAGQRRAALGELAASLGLVERADVLFLQGVEADLPAIYHGAMAFVILSWGESFSMPVAEAMACGLPVIASSRGAIPEVLGDAGILVDPRDPDQAVAAMQSLIDDEDVRRDLAARARQRGPMFSWRRSAELTVHAYRLAAGAPASGTSL